jgi:large subunit ribosomal protein L3
MKERKLGILGEKLGMTTIFGDKGQALGVTVLQLGPCVVLGKRLAGPHPSGRSDGYRALILGYAQKKAHKVNKAEAGKLALAGGMEKARRFVCEVRVSEATLSRFEVGQEISLNDLEFAVDVKVDVTGISKGKGFAGVMKRHHFGGFRATHGTHEYFRHGGSIGCRKWPGRVFKGRKMPGRMGNRRVTTQNIRVAQVRASDNVLLIRGATPGSRGSYVVVRLAIKKHPVA